MELKKKDTHKKYYGPRPLLNAVIGMLTNRYICCKNVSKVVRFSALKNVNMSSTVIKK